ncbi:MAG: tyrosine-protein phosphatase [Bacteroidota bacterium]
MSILDKLFSPGKTSQPVDLSALHTDFHSHFIPGVDDGADSLETSVELIEAMADLGYKKLITTPHIQGEFYRNSPQTILPGLEQVRRELKKLHISVELEAAAEYLIDDKFEEKYKNGPLLTFGKKHLLVEFSFFNEHPRWKDFFFDLQIEGYKIILAHPERYSYWFRSWNKYEELKDRGVFFQINIISLTGYYSQEVKKVAERMIDEEMVDFAGSDMHNMHYMDALRNARYEKYLHKLVESGKLLNHIL